MKIAAIGDFNATEGTYADGTAYGHSQVLRSSPYSQLGSAIAIPVGAGDKITASVLAKYVAAAEDPNVTSTSLASALISAFTGTQGAGNTEGGIGTINDNFGSSSLIGGTGFPYEDANAPKAFLNLMFLPDGNAIDLVKDASFAYDQIADGTTEAVIDGASTSPFDELRIENFVAPQNGYILVYLSNEGSLTDVYFDDMEITVEEHPVIQKDDYYPFGMAHSGGYQRMTAKENRFLYNGKELIDDLDLEWYAYGWRNYDAAIGRFMSVDPLAEKRNWLSPYNFVQNNPILRVDPDGALDDYYDTQGNYLGNDGQGNDIRLVKEGQEQTVSSKLNGDQTTEADRNAARGTDNSAIIQIDESARTMLQTISDHTAHDGVEHQALILLDIYSDQPRILAEERESGSNGETEMNTVIDNGKRYDPQTGFLVIGQAHGHPLTNDPNKVNLPGTSSQDQTTATSTGVPIYNIDSYQGGAGSSQNINRANPYPARRNQSQTLGVGKSGQTNIGRDALEIRGKKRSN